MEVIEVLKPSDIIYPLKREIFEDLNVAYHGTSSNYSEKIEKLGWKLNNAIYDMLDIKFVREKFDSLCYENSQGYVALRSWTLGDQNENIKRKRPSFASNYWTARNYARNNGGETLRFLFIAFNDFNNFINEKELVDNHWKKIKSELEKVNDIELKYNQNLQINSKRNENFEGYVRYNKKRYSLALKNIVNKDYIKEIHDKFQIIKKKYNRYVETHCGVVYALRIEPDWFDNWIEPYHATCEIDGIQYSRTIKNVDLFAIKPIPPENIIAKIIFPNGVDYREFDSFQPLPLPWMIELFQKYISKKNKY